MIGHVSPEAYVGGPIAVVKNGDTITIDIKRMTLDLVREFNFISCHMLCECFL